MKTKIEKKFDLLKSMEYSELDFHLYAEKLKTNALMLGDYELAAQIRLFQLENKKK